MQVLLNGLISGLAIAVLALAFATVYIPSRVFHVAQGAIYTAVPFVAWTSLQRGYQLPAAMGVALLSGLVLSVACELINHWRLEQRGAAPGAHLIASLGAYIVIVQAVAMIWGTETKSLRTGLDAVVSVGKAEVTHAQILTAGACVATLAAYFLWLKCTNLGLQFRALAENPIEFALRGYSVRRARLLAFLVSGLLTATVAVVTAHDIGFDQSGGLTVLAPAIVAVIIGGRQSFIGPVLGGLMLGLTRAGVGWYLATRWQEAVTFLVLVLFLFLRPGGIMGQSGRLEAEA